MKVIEIVAFAAAVWTIGLQAADPPLNGDAVMARYLQARQAQAQKPPVARMRVEITGALPGATGEVRLAYYTGERILTNDGIEYKMRGIEGDDTVKRYVIAKYLSTEMEARKSPDVNLAITPENYKFKFEGLEQKYDRSYYVFELEPREKRPGLFQGELWLDPDTFLPVREYGVFVKSPSVFLSGVYFVRDYWIVDGVTVLRRMLSDIEVRLYGTAQLEIWMSDYQFGKLQGDPAGSPAAAKPNSP